MGLFLAAAFVALSAHAQTLTIFDDALQHGFDGPNYSYGGGFEFSNDTPVHGGSKSIAFTPDHFANGVSLHYPDGSGNISTATYPVLRFWVHGGGSGGQNVVVRLATDNVYNPASFAVPSPVAGTWTEVVVSLSGSPFNAASFDRIDIVGNTNTLQPVLYFDDMVLGQPTATVVNAIQIDHDVLVGPIFHNPPSPDVDARMTSDRFTWRDSNGQPRVASLAHNDAQIVGVAHGGALREFQYQLSNSQTRTAIVTGYGNAAYGGFGYVVSHTSHSIGCGGKDDSPLGMQFAGHWQRIFEGRHHAIFRFTQLYPRNCPTSGSIITRYVPVTIDWVFSTGHDNPLWAITYDVDQIAATGGQPVAADTYYDDSRAPYGELAIDGEGFTDLNGVAWGDRYKFTTTNTSGTAITWNSPFNWTVANTVPYVQEWLDGPLTAENPAKHDATIGIVQTQTITQQDAGGARDLGVGSDITPYWHKTQADGVQSAGPGHSIPNGDNWPYQAMGDNFYADGVTSNNARMTWKTQYGFIGQTAYQINNGAVESSAATAPGYPKKSYSTYIVLGQRTNLPVEAQVAQVEAVQALTLTTSGGIGSVVTAGPGGVNRSDANVTYAPAGYNHVYGALAFSAVSSSLDANIAVGSGKTLKKPLFIVSNYTAGADPQSVKFGGVTLVADADYFASVRTSANELWITLNRDLSGATNHLEITGSAGGALATPANVVATATSSSQVTISWSAVAGAATYEIQRSVNFGAASNGFATLTTTTAPTTTYNNTSLTPNTTYLYKVRAVNGATTSPYSPIDPATTIVFTDDPLNTGVTAKAVHVTQLRTAVNAMRAAAGLGAQSFTDPGLASGFTIKAAHQNELRTALNLARSTIGLAAISYVDPPTVTGGTTTVKAAHIVNLRDGVK
ncbi:MAG: hypothetical protein QOC81_1860 [Thermoanaerobaculia bacterium]|jgi:hypothetical protein|nr:hypothetical protein [Thermoanaerobaculia bacterium]